MRYIISVCFILMCLAGTSQSSQARWHDQYKVKTGFEIGETQTYEVTEFQKVDNILLGIRSTIESLVRFEVKDTANGGYWILYSVLSNSVKKQHDSSTYIMSELTQGLQQYFYVKDGMILLDSANLRSNIEELTEKLDELVNSFSFGKTTRQFIVRLKAELDNGDGIAAFLAPLNLFANYYSAGVYKKFRIDTKTTYGTLFSNKTFTGLMGNKWESTSKDSTVKLSRLFTGDPVATARYHRPIYEAILASNGITRKNSFYPPQMRYINEYEFTVPPQRSFPSYLYKKVVSEYLWREVIKIEMKKW